MSLKLAPRKIAVFVCLGWGIGSAQCIHAQEPLVVAFQEASQMSPRRDYQVLRMDLDLTGDGQNELLLAKVDPSLPTGEQGWFIYTPVENAGLRMLGMLDFSYLLFEVDNSGRLVIQAPELDVAIAYRVDVSGIHELSRTTLASLAGDDELRQWRENVSLKVLSAPIQDVLSSDAPRWRNMLDGAELSGFPLKNLVLVQ